MDTLYKVCVQVLIYVCVEKNKQHTNSHGDASAVNTHALLKKAIMHYTTCYSMDPQHQPD